MCYVIETLCSMVAVLAFLGAWVGVQTKNPTAARWALACGLQAVIGLIGWALTTV